MSLEKDTKIDEVVEELSKRIVQGQYVAGQRLPSERELADELHVSRVTIRAASLRLQSGNLVDIVPRGGAFVRSSSTKATIASGPELKQSGSFIRAMQQQGRQTLVRFIEPSSIIPAGSEIGTKMNTDPGIPVLRRYRMHLVDRIPYRILDSYYLASLLSDLLGKDEGYIPLFKWLREHTGVRAVQARERLHCRMPSAEEARLLNISRGQPIVDMDRWVRGNDGTLFEYTHIIANGALHEFAYTYDLHEEASI
ncbi:MAG: GntR family transcriptional regulator [Ktedonobacteraceae bacterium]